MPVIIDGTNGVATPNTFAFKNRLIDAGFIINQRSYTSGTSLASGSYGHDRWKGGAGAGTYTFTQGSAGVPIVITITAGTIQQVIEGCNVPEGGTYTLSWTGTATARINSGSYAASPITVTGQTAGANMTIEFATGTVSYPQLETGAQATSFDYRNFSQELIMCQRYCYVNQATNAYSGFVTGALNSGSELQGVIYYPVVMRTTPSFSSSGNFETLTNGTARSTTLSIGGSEMSVFTCTIKGSLSGATGGQSGVLRASNDSTAKLSFTAEL